MGIAEQTCAYAAKVLLATGSADRTTAPGRREFQELEVRIDDAAAKSYSPLGWPYRKLTCRRGQHIDAGIPRDFVRPFENHPDDLSCPRKFGI
jgi:hypothetical protein